MKEIELTEQDFFEITGIATRRFGSSTTTIKEKHFLCRCYVEATQEYLNRKDWLIKDGKVYKK